MADKPRTKWTQGEEKAFLLLCQKINITEMLDDAKTSAGNEDIYARIQSGLVTAGYEQRETEKIRLKYRRLKAKFHDIREHNHHATGKSRMEWVFYELAESVWGHRAVASKSVIESDNLDVDEVQDDSLNQADDEIGSVRETDMENKEIPGQDLDTPAKKQKLQNVAAKFKSASKLKGRNSRKNIADSSSADEYFVDRMVELEEKRLQEQMKLEKLRLDAEKEARESQLNFQKEMFKMMMQMQKQQQQSSHNANQSLQYSNASCSQPYHLYEF